MDDCLRFEMAHIFSQETQLGLRNLGQTESETDQWSWLEYTEQWLTELAECSDHRAEASRCATHHHMIDDLWHITEQPESHRTTSDKPTTCARPWGACSRIRLASTRLVVSSVNNPKSVLCPCSGRSGARQWYSCERRSIWGCHIALLTHRPCKKIMQGASAGPA